MMFDKILNLCCMIVVAAALNQWFKRGIRYGTVCSVVTITVCSAVMVLAFWAFPHLPFMLAPIAFMAGFGLAMVWLSRKYRKIECHVETKNEENMDI